MKNSNFFLAFPFSMFCSEESDELIPEAKIFFEKLTNIFKENNIEYYSAQEREKWGEEYNNEKESTLFDYEAMKKSDIVICVPGNPYSGGTHIELGWASVLKKKIILLLEKDVYYSPLVTGISCLTNVDVYFYEDFYKDAINIVMKIVNVYIQNRQLDLIASFLEKRNEKIDNYSIILGGNNNKLYSINNKYFIKFKDELSAIEEKMYFKYTSEFSPKLYYSNIKNKMLVYELLIAEDLLDANRVQNLIEIVYKYAKSRPETKRHGYGYFGIENNSWLEFLTQEVNNSKQYLIDNNKKISFVIVDKALKNIGKYKFKKRILHGDFGLHNTMIAENKDIYFIDPEPVLGDWMYDFIFFCFSDLSVLQMIDFEKISNLINEDKNKVKSMMIIVLFNRLRRILKYSPGDFELYLEYWNKMGDFYND